MENLRWILIFAGVAILVLLYLSGRQSSSTSRRQGEALSRKSKRTNTNESIDPLLDSDAFADPLDDFDMGNDVGAEIDDPLERPGGQSPAQHKRQSAELDNSGLTGGFGGISSKIEAFGSKLSPKRRARVAASEPTKGTAAPQQAYASKIVTLHVAAPEGQLMNGAHLLEQFEQRGYHFGDMNIFHSMHDGKTVFSIAKLVMPGTFDINDMDSFQTPGISMILQLPGPVPADVAFEVLLSESHEIAESLGANVLDADRSTLSKQTVQHMREGIYEYMHRQKYFSGVPS